MPLEAEPTSGTTTKPLFGVTDFPLSTKVVCVYFLFKVCKCWRKEGRAGKHLSHVHR